MVIQHNLQAMNSQRQFNMVGKSQAKSTEKLSSGYRINRSADDAAGLAISEKMRRQIRGLTQASANCQDGISLVQIADGALSEIHDMLHRGTELSVKAANGTLTEQDRQFIQTEIEQLKAEIDATSDRTTFNEIPVLKGASDNASYIIPGAVEIRGGLPDFITSKSADLQAGHLTGTYSDGDKNYIAGVLDFSEVNATNIAELDGQGFHMNCATCNNQYSIEFTSEPESSKITSGQHFIYKISTSGLTVGNEGSELINRIIAETGNGHPENHYTELKKTDTNELTVYDNREYFTSDSYNTDYYRNESTLAPGVAYALSEDTEFNGIADISIQAGAEAGQHIDIKLPAISTSLLGISNVNVVPRGGI